MSERRKKFEAYVLPHLDLLYRSAVRLLGEKRDAEDLVQESCLRAYAAIDQLRDGQSSKAWLFRILRTTYLRQWVENPLQRKVTKAEDLESTLADFSNIFHNPYHSDLPHAHMTGVEIRKAISELPLPYREMVVLADVAGFKYKEIAQILRVPLGTVMSRLYRGRRMLRLSLRDYSGEEVPRKKRSQ